LRTRDENKEQTIRQKALEMIVEEGFDGFSMQKLAKAAGVSPATPYIYFKDREDLILQLFNDVNGLMMDATLKNFNPEMPFEEGLRVQWKNRAKYLMKYPLEAAFLEQLRHSPLYHKTVPVQVKVFKEVMKSFVHRAIERKELLPLPFEVYWSIAYSPLYQLVKYHQQGYSYATQKFTLTEKIIKQTLELVVKALKP
jgi:AcrR family transcriptional regulator